MNLSELLLEAKDWQDIEDVADRWLAKFTYHNLDKWPSKAIVQTLLTRYPAHGGTIYRGINFYSKEAFDEFMLNFHDDAATLSFESVTSWSDNEATTEQFAVTQPTYDLNFAVMHAYDIQKKNRERLSGYRGIILETTIGDNEAIDVNASNLGHESEIILPPGTYEIRVHRFLKLYVHQLADKDTTIDAVIQQATRADVRKDDSFYNYVMHHHIEELSPASRDHLFYLFKPNQGTPLFTHEVHTDSWNNSYSFYYRVPAMPLFLLYEKGIFRSPRQVREIRTLARATLKSMKPVVEKYFIGASNLTNPSLIITIAKIAGASDYRRVYGRMTDLIRQEYARLNGEEVKRINLITDDREKRDAMKAFTDKLSRLMQKLHNLVSK